MGSVSVSFFGERSVKFSTCFCFSFCMYVSVDMYHFLSQIPEHLHMVDVSCTNALVEHLDEVSGGNQRNQRHFHCLLLLSACALLLFLLVLSPSLSPSMSP